MKSPRTKKEYRDLLRGVVPADMSAEVARDLVLNGPPDVEPKKGNRVHTFVCKACKATFTLSLQRSTLLEAVNVGRRSQYYRYLSGDHYEIVACDCESDKLHLVADPNRKRAKK